ncbi:MAG: hypothetical protein HYZ73_02725 [Elusimicrobia bacterium]|nr:hypothetical protein [Elusimicrobiota bacterium]
MSGGIGVLLISAAVGYWVLIHAAKEKARLKSLGQLLGLVIIAVSLVMAASKLYCLTTGQSMSALFCPVGKSCPFMKGGSNP